MLLCWYCMDLGQSCYHWFLLIVLCLSLNGSIEMLLEIMKILSSANTAALDTVFMLEGTYCMFINEKQRP